MYACSLNLYSLALVRYRKSDHYIQRKIEPFLHGVPIAYGIILASVFLASKNLNSGGGLCYAPVYEPPHCVGYEDGEIREGFEIPCGRGHDGVPLLYYLAFFITFFAVPIIVGVSLWMIYKAVHRQERTIARYDFTANINTDQTRSSAANSDADDDERANRGSFFNWIRGSISSGGSNVINRQPASSSNSSAVMRRAFAFTISYALTWSFPFMVTCFNIANKEWPLVVWYLYSIFNPLQGFYNLFIFLQPKVSRIKSDGGDDFTWFQAIIEGIWSSGSGERARGGGRGGAQQNAIAGERKDQRKTSQTQREPIEAGEEIQDP